MFVLKQQDFVSLMIDVSSDYPDVSTISPAGEDKIIKFLSWNKVVKRQNPLQSFSFCVCDDGLLLCRFISIFHILLPSFSSSLSRRHRCSLRIASWEHTLRWTYKRWLIVHQDKHTTISQRKSFMTSLNESRRGSMSHTHIQAAAKRVTKPDKHMPAVLHTQVLLCQTLGCQRNENSDDRRQHEICNDVSHTHKDVMIFYVSELSFQAVKRGRRWKRGWAACSFSPSLLSCSPEGVLIGVRTHTHTHSRSEA